MSSSFSPASTIDEVIAQLDEIIAETKTEQDPAGYFAALYRKVTIKVKEGIESNYFEDGPRMEKLDVIFANRYLVAFHDWRKNEAITDSWRKSFKLADRYWPIVLQHLLIGMNAHINLDLGIAAAETSKTQMNKLQADFNKINEVLSSLVDEVQQDLASIWPTFKALLKLAGKLDNFLTDFSMKLARDGAWKFAVNLAALPSDQWDEFISQRDKKVAKKVKVIIGPGPFVRIVLAIIRIGERGSIAQKIGKMED